MSTFSKHRLLIAGILTSMASAGILVCLGFYSEVLDTRLFRFSITTLTGAMVIGPILPLVFTAILATREWRRRDLALYPTVFLIDRHGRLQRGFGGDQSFEKLESEVGALLGASQ